MSTDDKSSVWVLGLILTFFLAVLCFDGTIAYLEREHDIQQQRLEIKQRQMTVHDRELRNQVLIHCLGRTDISSDRKAKECWNEL